MEKFAIISKSHYSDGEWKNFHILTEGLTRENILSLKKAIPVYFEELKSKHPLDINLKIEGFELEVRGDDFHDYMCGKIIPMTTLEEFE
jgi:hypothetical protein